MEFQSSVYKNGFKIAIPSQTYALITSKNLVLWAFVLTNSSSKVVISLIY